MQEKEVCPGQSAHFPLTLQTSIQPKVIGWVSKGRFVSKTVYHIQRTPTGGHKVPGSQCVALQDARRTFVLFFCVIASFPVLARVTSSWRYRPLQLSGEKAASHCIARLAWIHDVKQTNFKPMAVLLPKCWNSRHVPAQFAVLAS